MSRKRALGAAAVRGESMRRREFLALAGAGAAGLFAPRLYAAARRAQPRRPNIVVIVADDLGYADLGCQGAADIPTPHIDSLARNGVRFTNGYVSGPVCSPTRAGLMTGRYQQRFGHEFNPGANASASVGLPRSEVTLADALKSAGYTTGAVGKWHLGMAPAFHPLRRGFDEFFGFLGGSHWYTDAKQDPLNPIMRGSEVVDEKEYLTDAFTREAVAFIARRSRTPFFLYLTYNAVHAPLQATGKYLDRFRGIGDEKRRTYAAMASAMDDGVGAVLRKLKETGLEQDTLIFFFSDNGGPVGVNGSSNAPLSGAKGMVREGGIRVPFIVQWPRRIAGGKTYDYPAISLDVFPTAVAAARGKLPGDRVIDGVEVVPFLTGEERGAPHDTLFWRLGDRRAVRRGDWKLMRTGADAPALYDLSRDVSESSDLARDQPSVARDLHQELERWESQLAPPRWQPAAGPRGRRARRQPPQSAAVGPCA